MRRSTRILRVDRHRAAGVEQGNPRRAERIWTGAPPVTAGAGTVALPEGAGALRMAGTALVVATAEVAPSEAVREEGMASLVEASAEMTPSEALPHEVAA